MEENMEQNNNDEQKLVRQIMDDKNSDALDTLQTIMLKKCAKRIASVQKE